MESRYRRRGILRSRRRTGLVALIVLSLVNLLAIAVASIFIGVITMLEGLDDGGRTGFPFAIIIMCVVWIFFGACTSAVLGRRSFTPLLRLVEAFKEVSKGNFEVKLDETSPVPELSNVAESFNMMVRDLKRTEAFHNDFTANVSHEFKTPIAAIEGYATLLQDEGLTKEARDEYISKILSNTGRLSDLSGNILKLARLERQEIVIEKSRFSLDEQIRQALLLHESKWNEKNLEVDIDLDSQSYYWNEELLMQIWVNIFDNAIKFTPENGTILARMRRGDGVITVEISDNGIGMDEETAEHIFDKFYQGDRSHYAQGNGLGMTLVKRIIDLCGGTIKLSSQLGKGTTFIIELPLKKTDNDAKK